jgi:hypothetical protein
MFAQQSTRLLFLCRARECPDHIADEGGVVFANMDLQPGHALLFEATAEISNGLALCFDQMDTS